MKAFKISCEICHKSGKMYLYVRDPLIFSLCKRCISTQLEIESYMKKKREEHNWRILLEAIASGRITRENIDQYIKDQEDRGQ